TFSDATLSNFQTTARDGAAPRDRITIAFERVAEDYKVLNPDGSVVSDNQAQFDASQGVGGGGHLSAPALPAPPTVGITFDTGTGPSSEIAVHDYSWGGMSGGGVARGSVQNVQLTLDPSSVEPGLWGNMLENRSFQAVVHVRDGSGHEYLTYTFSNAF